MAGAERELTMEIHRGSQRQGVLHEVADPSDLGKLVEIGQDWLRAEHWDEALWRQFTITVVGGGPRTEVRL
jgi:hypothetical protein